MTAPYVPSLPIVNPAFAQNAAPLSDLGNWFVIENSSDITRLYQSKSVAETKFRSTTMRGDVKWEKRMRGFKMGVETARSARVPFGRVAGDKVELIARAISGGIFIPNDDLIGLDQAGIADVLNTYRQEAAVSFAALLDTICLGAPLPTANIKSAYNVARTDDASVGYVKNRNYLGIQGADLTREVLLEQRRQYQNGGRFVDLATAEYFADPRFRVYLAEIVDTLGRPIFTDTNSDGIDRLFGTPINWTNGAAVTEPDVATDENDNFLSNEIPLNLIGNPLLILADPQALLLGRARAVPNSDSTSLAYSLNTQGDGWRQNATGMMVRGRRGFVVTNPWMVHVLETTNKDDAAAVLTPADYTGPVYAGSGMGVNDAAGHTVTAASDVVEEAVGSKNVDGTTVAKPTGTKGA